MHPILSQFHLQPVLIDGRQALSLSGLKPDGDKTRLTAQEMAVMTGMSQNGQYKPYAVNKEGIATIPVQGTLMHNLGFSSSYATGYDVIRRKLNYARQDPDVKGIFMPFHTPGGSVFGCPDTGDLIYATAQEKPVWTHSSDMSYSAGEWLHSQGSRRLVTQSGGMGSIGVLIGHVDMSNALNEAGLNVTLIHAGAHKVDGNPYESLSNDVRTELQAQCEKTRQQFATLVAKGTGMTVADVLETEAQCYTGSEAVDIGLADAVVSSNDVLSEFAEYLNQSSKTILLGQSMSKETQKETQPALTSAPSVAEQTGTTSPAPESPAASEDSAKAERVRIGSIMQSDAAKAHPAQAEYLAYQTDLSAEQALGILNAAPTTPAPSSPKAGSDAFLTAMNAEQHPDVSADDDEPSAAEPQTPDAQVQAMARDFAAATGVKLMK